jgi:hypothetical protein
MDRDGFLHRLGSASLIVIGLLLIGTAYNAVLRIRAVHAGRLAATDAARVERPRSRTQISNAASRCSRRKQSSSRSWRKYRQ